MTTAGLAAAGRLQRGGRSLAATFVLDSFAPFPVAGVVEPGEPPVPGARRELALIVVERAIPRPSELPPRDIQ